MTTQSEYEDAYDREANLGNALIEGEYPGEPLIDTGFGVRLLPSSNDLENAAARLKAERFANVRPRRNVVRPLIDDGYGYVIIDAGGGRGNFPTTRLSPFSGDHPLVPRAGSINGSNKTIECRISPIQEDLG